MSDCLTKSSECKKRKSDQSNESDKRIKISEEIIELSDNSNDELKDVIKLTKRTDELKDVIELTKRTDESTLKREQNSNPMRLYLNKVLNGIDEQFNNEFTLTIKEILSKKFGNNLKSSCQFSYTYDIDWLVNQYDEEYKTLPLTIVAQQKQPTIDDLKSVCKKYSNIDLCFARLADQFGTHHTKMMLLKYEEGLRIVIHTSNLEPKDWYQKSQGLWCSELLPKLGEQDKVEDRSSTKFQTDLIEYLEAYNCSQLKKWIAIIKRHDFSSVKVFLIGSVPGRHKENKLNKFGHMKVRSVLKQHLASNVNKEWSVLAQFSSIGTLGKSPENWIQSEFLDSLKANKQVGLSISSKPQFKIIFPTSENVRKSLEGYRAGASIPYQSHVAIKQLYLRNFMHQWKSELNGRTRAQPHIKSYCRINEQTDQIAYFILTSANLSKAAWGTLEKNASQLNIRSYELGVLFLPSFHGNFNAFERSKEFRLSGDGETEIIKMPLPYDLPLIPYSSEDQPWIIDQEYLIPDSHGNIWAPS